MTTMITPAELDQLHTDALTEYDQVGAHTLGHSHRTFSDLIKRSLRDNSDGFLGHLLDNPRNTGGWALRCALEELHERALAEYTQPDPFGESEQSWRDKFRAGVATWDDETLVGTVKYIVDRLDNGQPVYAAGYTRAVLLTALRERALKMNHDRTAR